jgi:2-methylcitrate dehydratase PrpD
VFALAGVRPIDGAAAARAIVAGYDIGVALADATHYDAGWHTSATVGSIAAAAAVSVASGLDADRAAHALSLAASFAAGLQGQFGTSAKAIQVGRASSSGLLAATLAERGVEGSLGVFDGETGWLQLHDVIRPFSPPSFGDGIRQASFKPYASAVVTHAVIEAVLSLPKEVSVGDVATVTVTVSPFARRLARVDQPTNGIAAKMSLTHAAAVALLDRRIEPAQFDDDRVLARDAEELRNRVRVGIDPAMPQFGARVEISLLSGRVLSRVIEAPLGSVSRPMTQDALVEKYRLFASSTLSSKAMLQVEDLALSLCVLPDISTLIERLAP